MKFIETTVFTRQIRELMVDDDYRLMQETLLVRPELGSIIPGSGGIRKVRWGSQEQGKRGGSRVIYYWAVNDKTLFMLMAYSKNKQENLTLSQVQTLKKMIKEEFNHG
ncbi:MAG: type II toxin-antitoxin system RelE/ParE family toxin [Magnetococcales bacterium]|nr:type II toxin-antitoxin system RelE/ParE family toxin [Magnetococcales bacterium]